MKRMKFSINSWIFGNLSIEEIARRAKEIGVDGIDVSGEPDTMDAKAVKATLDKYALRYLTSTVTYRGKQDHVP